MMDSKMGATMSDIEYDDSYDLYIEYDERDEDDYDMAEDFPYGIEAELAWRE